MNFKRHRTLQGFARNEVNQTAYLWWFAHYVAHEEEVSDLLVHVVRKSEPTINSQKIYESFHCDSPFCPTSLLESCSLIRTALSRSRRAVWPLPAPRARASCRRQSTSCSRNLHDNLNASRYAPSVLCRRSD